MNFAFYSVGRMKKNELSNFFSMSSIDHLGVVVFGFKSQLERGIQGELLICGG